MKTKVLFRKTRTGEILAVFPETPATRDPNQCVMARVGEHAACSIAFARIARPAKPKEAEPLKRELAALGYSLRVVSRFHPAHEERRRANLSAMLRK